MYSSQSLYIYKTNPRGIQAMTVTYKVSRPLDWPVRGSHFCILSFMLEVEPLIRNSSVCYLCLLLFDFRKTFISIHIKRGWGLFLKQNTFLKFDIVRRQFTLSFSKWCSKYKIVNGQQMAISYPTDSSDLKYLHVHYTATPSPPKKYPYPLPHGRQILQVKNRTLCIK